MQQKMATIALMGILKKKEEDEQKSAPNSASSSVRKFKMAAAEHAKENAILKELTATLRTDLAESRRSNAELTKKVDGLNSFIKRVGGSTDYMLKGSTSFFRKENQKLKGKVTGTAKSLNEIKRLNYDLVRTHELDRRAIEELSATISDLEFRIRMGIVTDEYTAAYNQIASELEDDKKQCEKCTILKHQLSKNAISLQCLVGRLKQMEETIFELKNDKRQLSTKLYGQGDKLGDKLASRLGSKVTLGYRQAA